MNAIESFIDTPTVAEQIHQRVCAEGAAFDPPRKYVVHTTFTSSKFEWYVGGSEFKAVELSDGLRDIIRRNAYEVRDYLERKRIALCSECGVKP